MELRLAECIFSGEYRVQSGEGILLNSQCIMHNVAARGGVFEAGRSSRKLRKCRKRFISQNIIGGTVCREAGWALRLKLNENLV